MLSKAKGQALRIAAVLHVLFSYDTDAEGEIIVLSVPPIISANTMIAAQNFVDTCCQHAAFIAVRENVEEEISHLTSTGKCK